jgi:hypothetical protein
MMACAPLYNYERESLLLGFPPTLAHRDRLVLALHAYFDESGTHADSEVVTVAGYISTAEQWELFGEAWRSEMAAYGLEFFHMTDFANRAGAYKDWTEQERRDRLARLIRIINQHAIASVGIAIPLRAFNQIFPKNAKRFVGGAYGLAAAACFLHVANILSPNYPSARIAYVFEIGARGSGEVKKVFDWNYKDREQRPKLKLLSIKFEGKEFTPLQAADILAYELYRLVPHEIGLDANSGHRKTHISMLADCNMKSWGRLEERELFKWAEIVTAAADYHGPSGRKRRQPRATR